MNSFLLPATLDAAVADQMLLLLREHAQAGTVLSADASRVEKMSLTSLQLLCVASRDKRLSIVAASEHFRQTASALALEGILTASTERGTHAEQAAAEIEVATADTPVMIKRILTIDDSKTMRDMLRLTLADAGFEVLQAVDGEDGVNVLFRERVDLVITDINMPKMDGYEVIRQVRAKPEYAALPILVLTTEAEADKRAIAREAGASGWMVKPFDPERLIEAVLKVAA